MHFHDCNLPLILLIHNICEKANCCISLNSEQYLMIKNQHIQHLDCSITIKNIIRLTPILLTAHLHRMSLLYICYKEAYYSPQGGLPVCMTSITLSPSSLTIFPSAKPVYRMPREENNRYMGRYSWAGTLDSEQVLQVRLPGWCWGRRQTGMLLDQQVDV